MNVYEETQLILHKYKIQANKSLGQNFLVDDNVIDEIIRSSNIDKQDLIIEIGPGLGVLTNRLLKEANNVIAVELDKRMVNILQDFSIFFPFITEEIFQELYHNNKSIHTTKIEPLNYNFEEEIKYGDKMIEIISQARGAKTNNNVSLKTPIKKLEIGVEKKLEKYRVVR